MSPELLRSYLYAPGDDAGVMRKALHSAADAVVLDLEDAVAPAARGSARLAVAAAIEGGGHGPQVHVRVGRSPQGDYDREDVRAIVRPGLDAIRLPKVEDVNAVRAVDALVGDLEKRRGLPSGRVSLYLTVESAAGLLAIRRLASASARIVRFAFGSSDYLADIAAGPEAADHARNVMVVQSRAARLGSPIDSVWTQLDDVEGLRREADRARRLGMFGKSVIHPRQLEPVHEAFTPTASEVAEARAVLDAWEATRGGGRNAIRADGQFIDPAIVARAHATLRLDKEARP